VATGKTEYILDGMRMETDRTFVVIADSRHDIIILFRV
jgi:hypothetical protein